MMVGRHRRTASPGKPETGGRRGHGTARGAAGRRRRRFPVDVTDYGALERAIRDAADRLGGLTTLCNNAGASLIGVFHGMKAGAPLVLESGGGSIVSTPEDVADVVVFLGSALSRFVTGQNVVVDGGRCTDQASTGCSSGSGRFFPSVMRS